MTPEEFREVLRAYGWSQTAFAQHFDLDPRTVRRWAAGQGVIPPPWADWLQVLRANPPPDPAVSPIYVPDR